MLDIHFDEFPVFKTTHLVMREVVLDDAPALYALRRHPDVTRYLDRENDKDLEAVQTLIASIRESFHQGNGITWGLALPADATLIGTMGIWRMDKGNHRGEVGYMLLPQFWGQGWMSEAMEVTIRFAFERIGLHSLEANTSVGNVGSHALLRKFGFVQEAHFKENWYFRGKFYDSVIFSLLNPKGHTR